MFNIMLGRKAYGEELSPSEIRNLALAAVGKNNVEIAREVHREVNTIKSQFHSIFTKLNVPNRTAAVAKAIQAGLL